MFSPIVAIPCRSKAYIFITKDILGAQVKPTVDMTKLKTTELRLLNDPNEREQVKSASKIEKVKS